MITNSLFSSKSKRIMVGRHLGRLMIIHFKTTRNEIFESSSLLSCDIGLSDYFIVQLPLRQLILMLCIYLK